MGTFTITSFNALWAHTPEHRPFDLVGAVSRFDTDVVALQEVWIPDDDPDAFTAGVGAHGYEVVHAPLSGAVVVPRPAITPHPHEAHGTWGVALLSRLPIRATRLVDLGRLVERWDVAERLAIVATLAVDDGEIAVAAIHLSFVVPNAAAQLRRLSGALPAGLPSVVVGDCNLWGPPAALAVRDHRRAVRGRTWPAHRPIAQLDHLLVSPTIEVLHGSVLPAAGSDHLPIGATLRVGAG